MSGQRTRAKVKVRHLRTTGQLRVRAVFGPNAPGKLTDEQVSMLLGEAHDTDHAWVDTAIDDGEMSAQDAVLVEQTWNGDGPDLLLMVLEEMGLA